MSPRESPSLAEELALDEIADCVFTGGSGREGGRIFGGLLVGQALGAAQLTVPDERLAHSLHASFVRPGRTGQPLRYEVERTHDGTSFATRRVVARQAHGIVLVMTADFQDDESGPEYELEARSSAPKPYDLDIGRYDSALVESRDVPPDWQGRHPHARAAWFRLRAPLPADDALHQQALAYVSDHGPTRAAREPHVAHLDVERRVSVSLDHAFWFHRRASIDQWLLYELVPVVSTGARGLAIGDIRTPDGTLLATVAQEVLLRIPS